MALSPANSHGSGYPLGLTGATAATRYVGGTTTGAPASGTFAVGDFVVAEDGGIQICTVAGSPGTWTAVSGGGGTEIGYDQITASVNITGTAEATPTTVITCAAHTFPGTAVYCEVFAPVVLTDNGAAGHQVIWSLWESGASLGRLGQLQTPATTAQMGVFVFSRLRFTPSAGSHTYLVRAYATATTNTPLWGAGAFSGSGTNAPSYCRFVTA